MENVFNILTKVAKTGNESNKKIAEYLLDYDGDYHDLKIEDIAASSYCSAPTVTRFAQNNGFKRFSDLRLALATYKEQYYGEQDNDKIDNIYFENHLNSVVSALEETKELNVPEDIEKIVKSIEKAQVINIYAQGETSIVAKDLQLKLIRIGINAVYDNDKHTQHFTACNSNSNTLAIGISYSAKTSEVQENLKLSKEYGAMTWLLASKEVTKPEYVDNILRVYANESISRVFSTTSRFALLFLIDIIYHELVNKNIKYYRTKLDETRIIRREK